MEKFYFKKFKICNRHVHVYSYEQGIKVGHKSKRINYKKSIDGEKQVKSLNRTRSMIKDIIDCNVSFFSKFITFTYRINQQDRKKVLKDFENFRKRFKSYYNEKFKYLAVLEKQKRGAYHIHIVCFNDFKLDIDLMRSWWFYGSIDVKKIDSVQNIGLYLMKYISKEMLALDCLQLNKRSIFLSRGLKRPVNEFDKSCYENLKLIYSKDYQIKFSKNDYIENTGEFIDRNKVNNVKYREYLF